MYYSFITLPNKGNKVILVSKAQTPLSPPHADILQVKVTQVLIQKSDGGRLGGGRRGCDALQR